MKFKSLLLITFVLHVMISSNLLNAQIVSLEQYTVFSSRIKNPVTLDLESENQNIYIYADNKSLYQYVLKIKFDEFRNLSPRVFEKETILTPGRTRLFTFKIVDPAEAPALNYKSSYYMAKSNYGEEKIRPYLVPIGKNHRVEFNIKDDGSSKIFYSNQFVMNPGDTIFNARKGTVTAMPDDNSNVERVAAKNSLEIHHIDGTIAIYIGINADPQMVSLGQTVFPGQPIGTMSSSKLLSFYVVEILDEGKLKSMDLFYAGPTEKLIPSNNLIGTKVTYPDDVVKKEMTKKEVNKFDKKTLY